MLTVNHIVTASILVFMMAFSPMSIAMMHGSAPAIASINDTAN